MLIDLQGHRVDIYLHSPLKLRNPTEEPCEEDQVGCDDEIARMTARGRCVMRVSSLYAVTESHLVVLQSGDFVANCLLEDSERPKGGFGLTAATVLRPQGPSLIAAATERAHFGRKSPYGELPKGITVKKSHRKILFRPKWALSVYLKQYPIYYLSL